MVAAIQDRNRRIVGVHRTFLKNDGTGKASLEPQKMALGAIRGGAARLAEAGDRVALAEGIETALSILQSINIPTWASLGSSNISRIELPHCVRQVEICADADPPGEKAAVEAAMRFKRQGMRVRIIRPHDVNDFNDRLAQ
jgi:hypothetical protein